MVLKGICSLCGKGEIMHTCHLCGRNVCIKCLDAPHGICVYCARGRV